MAYLVVNPRPQISLTTLDKDNMFFNQKNIRQRYHAINE